MLELLLALALTSVAAVLLAHSIGQISAYESKLSKAFVRLNQQAVPEQILRKSIGSMAALNLPGGGVVGTAKRADFRFLAPFGGHSATSLPRGVVEIEQEFDHWQLSFGVGESEMIRVVDGNGVAVFGYMDSEGEWFDRWPPPRQHAENNFHQKSLPRAIRLQQRDRGRAHAWAIFSVDGELVVRPGLESAL